MSDGPDMLVSTVVMPERGVFTVRVDDALARSGAVHPGSRGRFIVALDYGEDAGEAVATDLYDPAVHGSRIPGFRLLRALTEEDGRVIEENGRLAATLCNTFLSVAKEAAPDLRISGSRLSFGRTRLFIRYVSERGRPDFSEAQNRIRRQFGVEVNLRAMGPRDLVAENGGIGVCGRVCCCNSWQRRYPANIAPPHRDSLPTLVNGMCGRFKCCLAFERAKCEDNGRTPSADGV